MFICFVCLNFPLCTNRLHANNLTHVLFSACSNIGSCDVLIFKTRVAILSRNAADCSIASLNNPFSTPALLCITQVQSNSGRLVCSVIRFN